ncbi:MAG: multicopper polyphenol oxidase [Paenibacillus sp.]|jgi:YfiH family protein|nr:multicopper polyphenol oxidase [Paenibacillus sp.]
MKPFEMSQRQGEPTVLRLERWEREYGAIAAGFSTRIGGNSTGPYASLNCGLHVNDDPAVVLGNRKLLAAALQVPFEAWTCGEQVHGANVAVVTREHRGRGRLAADDALPDVDALITNEPGIWFVSYYADCVPIYFFDPIRRIIGLAHAGWKGSVLKIARSTVENMQNEYGSNPADIQAVVGPSIGPCCYEVDRNVQMRIAAVAEELQIGEQDRLSLYEPGDAEGKYMANLQQFNRQIMIKAGILPSHIEICGLCTGCRTDLFFSHRKEHGLTGRMVSWIGLELSV